MPSLAQLDDCVQAYKAEDPTATIVVVVDATFGHRIDPSEKATYDEAIDHGELLTPPAGAVGRGDGFILKIAEKVNAVVLSNDSFQEFHGDYPWLFDEGRLIGGKPVPTIGWVFTPRSPVRGPKSRQATSKVQGARKAAARVIPAKKLTVTLPDGVKPSIGDVISPPSLPVAPKTSEAPAPKKRAAKKAASTLIEQPDAEGEATKDLVPTPKKRASKKTLPREVATSSAAPMVDEPRLEAPKKRATKKAKTVDATVVGAVATDEGVVFTAEGAKSPAKRRTTRTAKATVGEAKPQVVVVPKRGAKKAVDPEQTAPVKKAAVKDVAPKKQSAKKDPVPVNEAMGFLTFVSAHPVDSEVTGTVTSFTSHGVMVTVVVEGETSVLCYAPTKHLSEPPPNSAREVVSLGQTTTFRVLRLDVRRRVAEVTLSC